MKMRWCTVVVKPWSAFLHESGHGLYFVQQTPPMALWVQCAECRNALANDDQGATEPFKASRADMKG